MHDVEQHLKGVFGIAAAEGQHVDPQQWPRALKAIKDSPSPDRNNLLWLAVAPINVFEQHNWLKDGKLSTNPITNVWTGAYKLSGAAWSNSSKHDPMISSPVSSPSKTKDPTNAPTTKPLPTKTPPTHASAFLSKGVSFDSEAKAAPTETGPKFKGLFLTRGRRQPKPVKVKAKAEKRTHEDGCYTVGCPPIDSDWKDAGAELVAHFVFMTEHFFPRTRRVFCTFGSLPEVLCLSPRSRRKSRPKLTQRSTSTILCLPAWDIPSSFGFGFRMMLRLVSWNHTRKKPG
jgi:hypothetical protein